MKEEFELSKSQQEFIAFLRGLGECEVQIKIVNSNPTDWFLSWPSYRFAYQSEISLGGELIAAEKNLIRDMEEIQFGELYVAKRSGLLTIIGGSKHYKSSQNNHDKKSK